MYPAITGMIAGDGDRLVLRSVSLRQGQSRLILNALQIRCDPVGIGPENALVKTNGLPHLPKGARPRMNSVKNDFMNGRHSGRGRCNLWIGHRGVKGALQLDQCLGLVVGKVLDFRA